MAADGGERVPDQPLPVEAPRSDVVVETPGEPLAQPGLLPGESGQIIRATKPEAVGGEKDTTQPQAVATPATAADQDQPTDVDVAQQAPAAAVNQASSDEAAARGVEPAPGKAGDGSRSTAVTRILTPLPPPAAAVKTSDEVTEMQASAEPAKPVTEPAAKAEPTAKVESAPKAEAMAQAQATAKVEPAAKAAPAPKVAKAPTPVPAPVAIAANHSADKSPDSVIQAERARLRAAAEKRFSQQVARAQDAVGAMPGRIDAPGTGTEPGKSRAARRTAGS